MKWLLSLALFLFMFVGCSDGSDSDCSEHTDCNQMQVCDNGSCISPTVSPEISIQYLSSGDTLYGYEFDENPEKEGIQTTIFVETKDLPEDAQITLSIQNGEEILKESTIRENKAVFKSVTLPQGEITLQVSSKDQYDRVITSQKLTLTIEEATIVFTHFLEIRF